MGVIGSAKLLQALARDRLIPGLSAFGQGTNGSDEPTYAIFLTYFLAQLIMLFDLNTIASLITMAYLMTFLVTNLACFSLKVGSAPNFRPSFHYFTWQSAAVGAILSGATMFFVDGFYASACVVVLIVIFLLIHYTTPPKSWGDVSQSLIYHQVRKYLLRLRQEHVKFWRPQILLLVNDPRRQWKLIQFCNSLKKGALFVLGHVIVSEDFGAAVPEARRQQASWAKYIDFSHIKAFVNIAIAPTVEWGARNIVLGAGLGGMRPNVVVMGFYNSEELRKTTSTDVPPSSALPSTDFDGQTTDATNNAADGHRLDQLLGMLPTDAMRGERAIDAQAYVMVLEDLVLRLRMNIAVAKGFQGLELPKPAPSTFHTMLEHLHLRSTKPTHPKKYIDLWPIQMSAEIAESSSRKNLLTTNFDTYTLILQLGCILNTVPSWKRTYILRVAVFVEYESDVEEERGRVTTLLRNLRIQAEVLVFWLASGELPTYEVVVNGKSGGDLARATHEVDEALKHEEWWHDIQRLRRFGDMSASQQVSQAENWLDSATHWPSASFQDGRRESRLESFGALRKMLRKKKRKSSVADLHQLGVSVGMHTHRLPGILVDGPDSASEASSNDQAEDEDISMPDNAVSDHDLSGYDLDVSDDEESTFSTARAHSFGASVGVAAVARKYSIRRGESSRAKHTADSRINLRPPNPQLNTAPPPLTASSKSTLLAASRVRPLPIRHHSLPKFTSRPTPRTTNAAVDAPGPSIMFTDTPSPGESGRQITLHPLASTLAAAASSPASGFPHRQALPLSFNDLPCRAQHLILNELLRQHSSAPQRTAVVLTTLPYPVDGTAKSMVESERFLGDLEVLCNGLPPVLLVGGNGLSVTVSL